VRDLRWEYSTDPLGIDTAPPRLSRKLETPGRGQQQTAYRVVVAAEEKVGKV
jgi:alpha-L-rhamnosidase